MSRDGSSLFGNGSLGQVAIYNGALNQQRVQDHFNSFGTNPRPKASFTISPSPAALNKTVTFNASSSSYSKGSIVKYEWDLNGTGTYTQTTTTPTITTTYSTEKTMTVGLRVTDSDFGTDYTTQTLFVGAAPPIASVKANPNPAIVNQNITFDATGSSVPNGSIADVKWDFDGSGTFATDTGTSLTTTHTFSTIGVHPVGLQLTSDGGKVTKTTINVVVLDTGVGDYEDGVLNTPGVHALLQAGRDVRPVYRRQRRQRQWHRQRRDLRPDRPGGQRPDDRGVLQRDQRQRRDPHGSLGLQDAHRRVLAEVERVRQR